MIEIRVDPSFCRINSSILSFVFFNYTPIFQILYFRIFTGLAGRFYAGRFPDRFRPVFYQGRKRYGNRCYVPPECRHLLTGGRYDRRACISLTRGRSGINSVWLYLPLRFRNASMPYGSYVIRKNGAIRVCPVRAAFHIADDGFCAVTEYFPTATCSLHEVQFVKHFFQFESIPRHIFGKAHPDDICLLRYCLQNAAYVLNP